MLGLGEDGRELLAEEGDLLGRPGRDAQGRRGAERAHRPDDHAAAQKRVVPRLRVLADVDEEEIANSRADRRRMGGEKSIGGKPNGGRLQLAAAPELRDQVTAAIVA